MKNSGGPVEWHLIAHSPRRLVRKSEISGLALCEDSLVFRRNGSGGVRSGTENLDCRPGCLMQLSAIDAAILYDLSSQQRSPRSTNRLPNYLARLRSTACECFASFREFHLAWFWKRRVSFCALPAFDASGCLCDE